VSDICNLLGRLAPLELAADWDNVGLLAGDPAASVQRMLLTIDLTPAVVEEARKKAADFVLAFHPPIFKPVSRITADAAGPVAGVWRCVAAGIAVYSVHTALDAAAGGTNDVLAELAGAAATQPLEWASPENSQVKLVVFVPHTHAEAVSEALFAAGAGRIGAYERCAFHLSGEGTFFGTEGTQPVVGRKGRLERVSETRVEMVCPKSRLAEAITALRKNHPYEEPAFDVYPLESTPRTGIGRIGSLDKPVSLAGLARRLKKGCGSPCVERVGAANAQVKRVIVVAGAAGSLPFRAVLGPGDAVVTGEMRHHDALTVDRAGAGAVVLGHWYSERPVLESLRRRITESAPVDVQVSTHDAAPLSAV
jgi:dinuclear metal center YbgI/SA1388 family protein